MILESPITWVILSVAFNAGIFWAISKMQGKKIDKMSDKMDDVVITMHEMDKRLAILENKG